MIGKIISHYSVTAKLGAGGMGEVYRATDTKLGRDVALKLLPQSLAADSARIARFQREAELLASLNHPNVASIYGLEEAEGVRCLVLELVEGPTLADRIAQGPIPLNEALPIAKQIAEALEAAHEKGIVHRDLKPANVKVTPEGTVKVLDFGLAKAFEVEGTSEDISASPTFTAVGTQAGMILGTAAYMSPEQARAKAADRRADVWAFGAVLYEMLTGKQVFGGETVSDTLAGVLKTDPDWEPLPAEIPATIRKLLRRCLQKDRKQRLQAIGEARIIIDECLAGRAEEEKATPRAPGTGNWRRVILAAAVAVLLVAAVALIGFHFGRSGAEQELPWRTFTIAAGQSANAPSISPDGRHIAYIVTQSQQSELWIQDLNQNKPRRVAGPQAALYGAFWSPDSQYVGFAEGKDLKKVSAGGGPSVTICPLPEAFIRGATWSPDGETIVFSSLPSYRLYEVPAVGGSPKAPFVPDKADAKFALVSPVFLPTGAGDRKLLYVRATSRTEGQIVARDLKTGRTEVVAAGVGPVYSPTGHVLFWAQGSLWAVPFSVQDLRPSGEPFPIREGAGFPTVARDGTLVYQETGGGGSDQLVWKSRTGEKLGAIGQPQESIYTPLLSPDGTKVAVWGHENGNDDIWIQDVARGLKTRLTFDPAGEDRPIWSPDGRRVAFASNRNGNWDVFIRAADGTGEAKPLLATPNNDYIMDWSRDGKYMVFDYFSTGKPLGVEYLRRGTGENEGKVVPFLATQFEQGGSDLSPDGRFLAYRSNESGRFEVYVQRFPEGGDKVQVSTNGGVQPRWRGDGRELYYVEGETLVAVPVTTTPKFSVGKPTRLFEQPTITRRTGQQYDVSRDGQRFVVIEPVGAEASNAIRVVQNWFAEFRNKNQQGE